MRRRSFKRGRGRSSHRRRGRGRGKSLGTYTMRRGGIKL